MNKLKFTLALVLIALFALQSCDKQEIVEDETTTPEQETVTPSNGSEMARVPASVYYRIEFHWPEGTSIASKIWTRTYYCNRRSEGVVLFADNYGNIFPEIWDMITLRQTYYVLPPNQEPPTGNEIPRYMPNPIIIDGITMHNQ